MKKLNHCKFKYDNQDVVFYIITNKTITELHRAKLSTADFNEFKKHHSVAMLKLAKLNKGVLA